MAANHISNVSIRCYLLGQLPDEQAAMLEEEYFTNREFLLKVQSQEISLIADYLDQKLLSTERQCFESRYLQVPLLQQKVEEIRRQRIAQVPARQPAFWTGWRAVLPVTAAIALAVGIWLYRVHLAPSQGPIAGPIQPQAHSVIAVRISPGQSKGPHSNPARFEPPASDSIVNLVLELPGRALPAQCQVRIWLVNADGRWTPVWNSSRPLTSSADSNKGQTLVLQIGGSLLRPGDYVVEAWTPDGKIREIYVYEITKT